MSTCVLQNKCCLFYIRPMVTGPTIKYNSTCVLFPLTDYGEVKVLTNNFHQIDHVEILNNALSLLTITFVIVPLLLKHRLHFCHIINSVADKCDCVRCSWNKNY